MCKEYSCDFVLLVHVISGNLNLCPRNIIPNAMKVSGHVAQYGKKCYERNSQRRTWDSAEQDCRSKGGHLLQIGTLQEETYIQMFFSQVDMQHVVWIGLHGNGYKDIFSWISGEHSSGYN